MDRVQRSITKTVAQAILPVRFAFRCCVPPRADWIVCATKREPGLSPDDDAHAELRLLPRSVCRENRSPHGQSQRQNRSPKDKPSTRVFAIRSPADRACSEVKGTASPMGPSVGSQAPRRPLASPTACERRRHERWETERASNPKSAYSLKSSLRRLVAVRLTGTSVCFLSFIFSMKVDLNHGTTSLM